MNELLKIDHLSKSYNTFSGEILAIKDISLVLHENEFLSIVGSSGCGKSTLLNIISKIDSKDDGKIAFFKKDPVIGYMLQDDALLPYLTILENACLGLDIKNKKSKENVNYVKNLLSSYGLEDFINKYPHELSGGMRQRVACISFRHILKT